MLDDHSRYAISLEACGDELGRTVQARLTTAFRRYGLPDQMLMDNGGGPQGAGSIGATWELGFSAWRPKEAKAARYYLGPNGALGGKPEAGERSGV